MVGGPYEATGQFNQEMITEVLWRERHALLTVMARPRPGGRRWRLRRAGKSGYKYVNIMMLVDRQLLSDNLADVIIY